MLANTHVRDDPRVMPEAASLARAGYAVCVLGAARVGGRATCETAQGVRIINLPMVTGGQPLRLLRELWRVLRGKLPPTTAGQGYVNNSRLATIFFTLWALRIGLRLPAVVVHCHDIAQLPPGWVLARIKRRRLVYDAHDDAADYYGKIGSTLEQLFIRRADVVITVGERLAEKLRQRGGRRVVVIGNWKNLAEYDQANPRIAALRQSLHLDQQLTICYYGTLNHIRYLPELLQAVEQSPEVTLLISGKGPFSAEVMAAAERAPNIRWLGWLSLEELPLYTLAADVVYCCINPDVFVQAPYVVPNKLFEAFAAGKVILAKRGVGEMAEILEKIPAAVMLDDVTPETLKQALRELQHPATRQRLQDGAQQGRDQYNWGMAEERLYALYADLLNVSET